MKWRAYPKYKDSGVEWLGEIPEHWDVQELKYIASARFSNVDKHTVDGEQPVRLCNYVDVYYNDYITADLSFMEATATPVEIARFKLKKGNVIVTKDSETWDDIAVPAYVSIDFSDVLCGYHLAQISPNTDLVDGEYLFRSFCARGINDQFRVAATGITRYGLGKYWLDNALFLVPPVDEQRAIAAFLDRETERIDALIARKERQIELLQEKRAALISHAVTKGLDPTAPMKDSGVEWLGEIPEGWEVIRVKALEGNSSSVVQTGPFGAQLHAADYVDEGVPLILIRNVADLKIDDTDIPRITHEDAERLSMYRLEVGDIVFSRVGSIGRIALCTDREKGWLISGQMLRLRVRNPKLNSRFSMYAFSSEVALTFVALQSVGSTRESINTDILRNMPLPIPPSDEQRAIAAFLDRETERIDALIAKVREAIEWLQEYRTALISAAVTGKIDVRDG